MDIILININLVSPLSSVSMNQPDQEDEAVTIDLSSSQLPTEMRAVHDYMKETYPGRSSSVTVPAIMGKKRPEN